MTKTHTGHLTPEERLSVQRAVAKGLRDIQLPTCRVLVAEDGGHVHVRLLSGTDEAKRSRPIITATVYPGLDSMSHFSREDNPSIRLSGSGLDPSYQASSFQRRYGIKQDLSFNPKLFDVVEEKVDLALERYARAAAIYKAKRLAQKACHKAMRSAGWLQHVERDSWHTEGSKFQCALNGLDDGSVWVAEQYDGGGGFVCLPESAPRAAEALCALHDVREALADERHRALAERDAS